MGTGDLGRWPVNIVGRHCFEQGVIIGGFVPNTLRVAPPLNVSEAECDEFLAALDGGLSELDALCSYLPRRNAAEGEHVADGQVARA